MKQVKRDLIILYRNLLREIEGDTAKLQEVNEVLARYGIELDDDHHPIEEEDGL